MKQFLDKKLKGVEMKEISGGASSSCVRCGVTQVEGTRSGTLCRSFRPVTVVCRGSVSQGWVKYQVWEKKIGIHIFTRIRVRTATCHPSFNGLHGWTPCAGGRWYGSY